MQASMEQTAQLTFGSSTSVGYNAGGRGGQPQGELGLLAASTAAGCTCSQADRAASTVMRVELQVSDLGVACYLCKQGTPARPSKPHNLCAHTNYVYIQ